MNSHRSEFALTALTLALLVGAGCASNSSSESETTAGTAPPPPLQQGASPESAGVPADALEADESDRWPRQSKRDGVTYTIYQPQIESWENLVLKGRAAVAYQADGAIQPTYGVIDLEATTDVKKAERLVFLDDVKIPRGSFPAQPEREAALVKAFSGFLQDVPAIGLDRLEASLAVLATEQRTGTPQLRNDPPKILFAQSPTMLVTFDGPPQFAPSIGTNFDRAINTRVLLLRSALGQYYLHIFDGFVTSARLGGEWVQTTSTPELLEAKAAAVAAKQIDLLAGQPNPHTNERASLSQIAVPALIFVYEPTELVVTTGEPTWEKIPGTALSFVSNTPSHVFWEDDDRSFYVLISGRWFRADAFPGPWTYVPPDQLVQDFAAIPDESPKENAKASVPGTRQAKESVIANSVPQTTRVERAKAHMDPEPGYDDGPKLAPIEETPLFYVRNCPTPIIKVDAATWYACQNSVWFVATSAHGPWTVATAVPAVIYSIPASSPVHYVTYVKIYRSDETYVWVGYTPGYYGAMVTEADVVVYGTGYWYDPYVSSAVYVAYPVTYGYSTNMYWTPWAGWAFGFGVGFAWSAHWGYWAYCPPAPYWGAYWGPMYGWGYNAAGGITAWGPYGWAGTSGAIYSHAGPWHGVSRVSGGYNAWTGNRWASQYGRAYNSVTGTRVAGQRGAVGNVYTGSYAFGARGVAHNDRTGMSAIGRTGTAGNVYTGRQVSGGTGVVYNPETGNATRVSGIRGEQGGAIAVGDNVIAGRDGQAWLRGNDGQWQAVSGGGLGEGSRALGGDNLSATGGASSFDLGQYDSFNREVGARSQGEIRQESYRSNNPSWGGGYSGGGWGGGGGFRGGGFRGGRR